MRADEFEGLCWPVAAEQFEPPTWQLSPELFFSDNPRDEARAKAICLSCPIVISCRTGARQRQEEFGTFGAETASERRAHLNPQAEEDRRRKAREKKRRQRETKRLTA